MPPCGINDLRHFCFRHFVGVHATHADAVLMDLTYTRDTTSGDEGLDAVTRNRSPK